ncbi:MAG: G1 family glutamic endopeptidase [Acidimicrobiales bacterium]
MPIKPATALRRLGLLGAIGALVLVASTLPPRAEEGARPAHVNQAFPHLHHSPHASQTWSGYAVTGDKPYTSISGSWSVPPLNCAKGSGFVSPWIGIDGWANETVEQIGVDYDCMGGKASYHTWVEMYPANSIYFTETVKAGDVLAAKVTVSGSSWVLTESDYAERWTKTFHKTASAAKASAEAILEDLGNSPPAPYVDDFRVENFRNLQASGKAFAAAGTAHKTSLKRASTLLSKESALSKQSGQSKSEFSITWLHR